MKTAAKLLSYATSEAGNLPHIAGRLFELRTGLDLTAVPYNTPAMLSDVMTGTLSTNLVFTAVPMVRQKQIKALAITQAPVAGASRYADHGGSGDQGLQSARVFRHVPGRRPD